MQPEITTVKEIVVQLPISTYPDPWEQRTCATEKETSTSVILKFYIYIFNREYVL